MDYDKLKTLIELRKNGDISEEEFEREKTKLLNEDANKGSCRQPLMGMEENNYLMLMHLSQFAGFIIPLLGFVAPIVLWMLNKDVNANVDLHGKNILNFNISFLIYTTIAGVLCLLLIGIPILILLGILWVVFVIVGTLKASNGELWKYPLSMELLK